MVPPDPSDRRQSRTRCQQLGSGFVPFFLKMSRPISAGVGSARGKWGESGIRLGARVWLPGNFFTKTGRLCRTKENNSSQEPRRDLLSLRRRGWLTLFWTLLCFAAAQFALDRIHYRQPAYRDPTFGHKLNLLRQQLATDPERPWCCSWAARERCLASRKGRPFFPSASAARCCGRCCKRRLLDDTGTCSKVKQE